MHHLRKFKVLFCPLPKRLVDSPLIGHKIASNQNRFAVVPENTKRLSVEPCGLLGVLAKSLGQKLKFLGKPLGCPHKPLVTSSNLVVAITELGLPVLPKGLL